MSKPTNQEIVEALKNHNGNASAAARSLNIPARTFRRWVAEADLRNSVNQPDKRKLTSQEAVDGNISPETLKMTPDELMQAYGLDFKDYIPVKLDISERDAGTATSPKVNRAISLTVQPKIEMPKPAFEGRTLKINPPKRTKANAKKDTELVIVVSDYHAPYVDFDLHQKSLRLIKENQPNRIIVNGDLVDFPTVGRHRQTTTRCTASASECIQVGGQILADLRAAAPDDCQIDLIPGNHDAWLNNYLLAQAGALYELTAYEGQAPVWSFENLFRLNEIGINLIGEPDTWPHSYIALTPHLVVHHGDVARKGAGASPLSSMAGKDFAEVHGHTHRQSIVGRTVWLANGETRIYQGGECGAMCVMEQGGFPTYTRHPDWQPGFATIEIDSTGHYSMDLASYQKGATNQKSVLMWRGKKY